MFRWRRKANEFAMSRLDRQTEEPAMSWNAVTCNQPVGQGNDFELIPTVYMESQHSVDSPTSRDFSSIYIVSELWRPEVGSRWSDFQKSCLFGKKTTPYGKIFKDSSERIHGDTDPRIVCKFRDIWPTGSRWNRALLTWQKQNFRSLSRSRFYADRAKNLPGLAAYNVLRVPPNFIQIGSLPAEL